MNGTELIRARRSIRKYKAGEKIPREDIQTILEAAMMAPSANNSRPWEFVVVESREILNQLMTVHQHTAMLATASAAIVVCGRPDLQPGKSFWPQDCGAAIENLLLQAADLGYGTCWCGCYPVQERAEGVQAILQVTSIPVAIVALGVPDESPAPRGYFDPQRVIYR